jgi:hypothetical protein
MQPCTRPRPRAAAVRSILLVPAVLLAFAATPARAQTRLRVPAVRQGQPVSGIEGLRLLFKTGNFRDTETYALRMLWDDIRQPEVLYTLAQAEERLRKPQEAAVYYTLFLRVLDEAKSGGGVEIPADVEKQKPFAERRLKALRQDEQALTAAYAKKVAGKKFESPEKVDDAWMDNAKFDLFGLHGLYAWKLLGGRKDAKPDWIHNTKGSMHRSGAKYVDEVEGRKGVLFTIPLKGKDSADADQSNRDALQKLGHNSHVEAVNAGGRKFVRIGARGYGFPFDLKVLVDGKEVKTERVGTDAWSDLKVPLPKMEAKPPEAKPATDSKARAKPQAAERSVGQKIVAEFIVPEGQKSSEGVWIDYFDFFDE